MALSLAFAGSTPLLGKPTRTLPRPGVRFVEPTPHATHERASRHTTRPEGRVARRDAAASSKHPPQPRSRAAAADVRGGRRTATSRDFLQAADPSSAKGNHVGRAQRKRGAHTAEVAASPGGRSGSLKRKGEAINARLTDSGGSKGDFSSARSSDGRLLLNDGGVLRGVDAGDPSIAAAAALSHMKPVEEEAATPLLIPKLRVASLYDSRGHLMVPAPLYGSHEILLHQNQMADRDGLDRIRDDSDLVDLLREKKLVPLPAGEALQVDERLPDNRRYSRPWTAEFLSMLSRDYYANFHQPLQVTSAVRTVAVQERLVRTNGNAAPAEGETASPHLTGQAVDIAKHGLTMTQIAWMRTYLQPLIDAGKIDVEEEFRQACFHISVYKGFLPVVPRVTVATGQSPAESRP